MKKIRFLIVRMNSTTGPWIVERDITSGHSIADIDSRRWHTKEAAQKAADKKNQLEKK